MSDVDKHIEKLSKMVKSDLDAKSVVFSIQGKDLVSQEVASADGMLPVLLHKAAIIYEDMFGKPMALGFVVDKQALCETVPVIAELANAQTFSEYAHCLHTAVEDLVRSAKYSKDFNANEVPLDDLYESWFERLKSLKYKVFPPRDVAASPQNKGH